MRNKKAKMLRKMANRLAQLQQMPDKKLIQNSEGTWFHMHSARNIYQTMKRRYKENAR